MGKPLATQNGPLDFRPFADVIDAFAELPEARAELLLKETLAELSIERQRLSTADDQVAQAEFRMRFLSTIHESVFCRYCYDKPRGYAGDFVTQEMIWLGRTEGLPQYSGETARGKRLTSATMSMENLRANEERVAILRDLIQRAGPRMASIGCGSCIELWDASVLAGRDVDIVLVDQDRDALTSAETKMQLPPTARATFCHDKVLRFILRAKYKLGQRDLIYLFGLVDYFSLPSAKKIVTRLWPAVAPDGKLVVTNAHPGNPTRLWMEYGTDWYLDYKTEAELRSLAEGLPECRTEVRLDSVGVYQYLVLTRTQ